MLYFVKQEVALSNHSLIKHFNTLYSTDFFKTNIFTGDITRSFTQSHLHFVGLNKKKYISRFNNQREKTCFTHWPKILLEILRYRHHQTFIIETKLLGIIFAIDYIMETPTK